MFLLGVLFACQDITLTKMQDPQPEIVVLPEIIDFGNINLDKRPELKNSLL
jgi:hypothetical protein